MKAAQLLHNLGQSIWLDNITRELLNTGTLKQYVADLSVTGLTSNPTIFDQEGLPAIEESIFAGVPINVTLLFSREHYIAAAEAFLRGIERRITAGRNPSVGSVASVFVSRWDVAAAGKVPEELNNRLGIAVAPRTYKAYRDLLTSPRWQRVYNAGARPQRLLWANKVGVNIETLATQLQDEGAESFVKSWKELIGVIASKSDALKEAA
jgi:transaldolase